MGRKLFALTLALALTFTTSCAQPDRRRNDDQQRAIGGVESSISEMGNIERVKITADNANIRTGCNPNAPVTQSASRNDTYNVVSKVSDWFAVKLPDNSIGFVPSEQCKPIVVEDRKPEMTPETTTTPPQGATAPKTPTAQTNTTSLSTQEQQMLKLVNDARAQNNLPPLKADVPLSNVARTKSQDMITNNYFSHNSPKYGSPFDMMKSFGISYVQAGENIAGNQTVQAAHTALMNSPGHRKNILSPDFTHIGIGIKQGGPYGNMFTQMFVSKPQ